MSIKHYIDQGVGYMGRYRPSGLCVGYIKAAGWKLSEKTGTALSWDDTYNDTIQAMTVRWPFTQAVTVQGKNLFDKNRPVAIANGVTKTVLETGVRATATVSGSTWFAIDVGDAVFYLGKTVRIRANVIASASNVPRLGLTWASSDYATRTSITGSSIGTVNYTFPATAPDGMTKIILQFYSNNGGTAVAGDYVDYTNVQLEFDSATPYEPFVPDAPSRLYPSPIVSIGDDGGITLSVTDGGENEYSVTRDVILRSTPDGTCDEWYALLGEVPRNVGTQTISTGSSWDITGAEPNSVVGCTHCPPTALAGTTLTIPGGITDTGTVVFKRVSPTTESVEPVELPTPLLHMDLDAGGAEITASVRVIDRDL
jgi:hypothetical protein